MFEKANGKGEDKGTKRTDKDPNGHKKFYSTLANVFKGLRLRSDPYRPADQGI